MSSSRPPQRSDRLRELSTGVWRARVETTWAAAADSPAAMRAATSSAALLPAEALIGGAMEGERRHRRRGEAEKGLAWHGPNGRLRNR